MNKTDEVRCCICGDRVSPPYNMLGQRAYCARHFAQVNKPHTGFWRAGLIQLAGMAAFAAIISLAAGLVGQPQGVWLWVAGLFLALVPSALWLVWFYREDRLEPEPKTSVAGVVLVAMGLYDVIGRRVIDDVFQVSTWASRDTWVSLLASVLIVGVTYQAVAYVAVRAVVYGSAEFDERMDGIVYGTAAGLGVAALLNLRFVLDSGGVALAPGVIRTVTTALAQASFGGLLGWFMAQAKFEHKPTVWVPAGFALAAILNGLFTWLVREVSASGLGVDPFRSLGLGLAVAVVTFLVLVALMRRSNQITLAPGAGTPEAQ